MCGIAGVWQPASDLRGTLQSMTSCLRHRGPDAEGQLLIEEDAIGLGHRRLAIVDLSETGAQPMSSSTGRYSVVFNGEIYNFRRLRSQLEQAGLRFRGTSDTEVLLELIERHGVRDAIPKLDGMFALSVWDRVEKSLWLVRDRLGEKPLFYCQAGPTFAWASELKSLQQLSNFPRDIDPIAIADVLERGYVRGTRCIFTHVKKQKPGTVLQVRRVNHALEISEHVYWSVPGVLKTGQEREMSDGAAVDALENMLKDVIRDEMMADVPVGAFLSGGIDSSLIVALMQRVATSNVRTFTIGFEESVHDESAFAQSVAAHLGTEHTAITLAATDALTFVDRLPAIFDEPFADSSQLPTLLVCTVTRAHVTVALSGDGGDELFGGYSQYLGQDSIARFVSRVPRFMRPAAALGVAALPERAFSMIGGGGTWSRNARARMANSLRSDDSVGLHESHLSAWADPRLVMARQHRTIQNGEGTTMPWPAAATFREAQMAYDMQTYLPDDILVKVDRSAMAVSLETRAPLLHHRVVEFALRQPLERKIRNGKGKFLLKLLLERHVPARLWDRPKQGFAIPLAEWLRGSLREWSHDLLVDDVLLRQWFDPTSVSDLWAAHLRGEDHAARLWRILMVMQWLRVQR